MAHVASKETETIYTYVSLNDNLFHNLMELTQQKEHEEDLQPEVTASAAVHYHSGHHGDHC